MAHKIQRTSDLRVRKVYWVLRFCVNHASISFKSKGLTYSQLMLFSKASFSLDEPLISELLLDMNQLICIPQPLLNSIASSKLPIETLAISRNPLSLESATRFLTKICPCQFLKQLDIKMCKLTGEEAGGALGNLIKVAPSLEELDLSLNFLSGPGIHSLVHALPVTTTKQYSLQTLKLDNNLLSNKDAELIAMLMQKLNSLQILSIQCNKFGPYAGKVFGNALKSDTSIRHFNISHNHLYDDGLTGIIGGLEFNQSIQNLYVSGIHATQKSVLNCLGHLSYSTTNLEYISFDLNKTEITQALLKAVKRLLDRRPTLQCISMLNGNRPPLDSKLEIDKTVLSKLHF